MSSLSFINTARPTTWESEVWNNLYIGKETRPNASAKRKPKRSYSTAKPLTMSTSAPKKSLRGIKNSRKSIKNDPLIFHPYIIFISNYAF